ncbi:hypothetical protein OG422_27375 [Streptomyces sp. NBC_01525]|uniref:hypothetical protein n=1 Tax=Streptomyces sp. NBC_01525 TaxID=2903893 RepID=UPI0038652E56
MNDTRVTDALALRAMASAFDAQRGKLPVEGDPHRSPDGVAIARQISELGKLISDLGNDVLFRTADHGREARTLRVIDGFAGAVRLRARQHPLSGRWPISFPSWAGPSTSATSPTLGMLGRRPRRRSASPSKRQTVFSTTLPTPFTSQRKRIHLRPRVSRPPAAGPPSRRPLHLPLPPPQQRLRQAGSLGGGEMQISSVEGSFVTCRQDRCKVR